MKSEVKKLFLRVAMMLAFMVLTTATAWADAPVTNHKIVVIADPHVMASGYLQNDGTAWQTYLAGSRKLIDYSKALFDQAVSDIKDNLKPELVLIVGDLTKDGEQLSHNYVKVKLDELRTAGIPTLVIPGNHDLGTSDAKIYDGDNTANAPTIGTAANFTTYYTNYGYGASSDRLENTLTYACEPISGLVVIGIDSGTDGVLSETTLNWVCTKATTARAAGKQVIAMMHHPLIPHITGGNTFVETVCVANSAAVRNRLADAGITTIFTGHFHTSDIAKDWNADKTKTIIDVNTGSLCSYPCDYRVVTLNPAMTEMSIATNSINSAGAPIGGGDNFNSAIAKTRLTTVMTNLANAKIKAKAIENGLDEVSATIAAAWMAPKMVDAYIYHAEGNENLNSDAQDLLTELNTTFASYPTYLALLNSMLLDKSNYGDADREDQTNDRTLNIINLTANLAESSYWTTFFRDGANYQVDASTEAYKAELNGNTVALHKVTDGIVNASTAVILKSTASSFTLTQTATNSTDAQTNNLHGVSNTTDLTYVKTTYGADAIYVLGNINSHFGFHKYTGSNVPAGKAFLALNGTTALAPSLDMYIDEVTGIKNVQCSMFNIQCDSAWYTLSGTRLDAQPTAKGLYIHGGRKVVIK